MNKRIIEFLDNINALKQIWDTKTIDPDSDIDNRLAIIWWAFTDAIDEAAELFILYKLTSKVITQTTLNQESDPVRRNIAIKRREVGRLRKLLIKASRSQDQLINATQLVKGNILIAKLNFLFQSNIPFLAEQ